MLSSRGLIKNEAWRACNQSTNNSPDELTSVSHWLGGRGIICAFGDSLNFAPAKQFTGDPPRESANCLWWCWTPPSNHTFHNFLLCYAVSTIVTNPTGVALIMIRTVNTVGERWRWQRWTGSKRLGSHHGCCSHLSPIYFGYHWFSGQLCLNGFLNAHFLDTVWSEQKKRSVCIVLWCGSKT